MATIAPHKLEDAEVFEVLPGVGLAHVRSAQGEVYGISRQTPGVRFDLLQVGQRVRCEVTPVFGRVLRASLVE